MTNIAISTAVAASWTDPATAEARSKRYAAAIKIGKKITTFRSVPAALTALGVEVGHRSIRAAARDNGFVQLDIEGKKVTLAVLEK